MWFYQSLIGVLVELPGKNYGLGSHSLASMAEPLAKLLPTDSSVEMACVHLSASRDWSKDKLHLLFPYP